MKKISLFLFAFALLFSCETDTKTNKVVEKVVPEFQNKGHELVYNMVEKVGNPDAFFGKNNVEYTYTYTTPDGSTDKSTEKYIFDGELSYGKFKQHERTLPQLEGTIEQGFDGKNYWLKHNGEIIDDSKMLNSVKFGRPTTYYWFSMWPKLLDPGLTYEHKGVKTFNGTNFDIVDVSFSNEDKPKDIYQLHINQKTGLVDQFLFTVAEFGLLDTPLLMEVEHENVDGLMIPTKRRYALSNWDATLPEQPEWTHIDWSNIKFNTDLTKDMFMK